jgi:carnitine O-acetyltransferase
MYCLIQREINGQISGHTEDTAPLDGAMQVKPNERVRVKVPAIFTDPGFNLLGTSILSTSNCGNPALRVCFDPDPGEGEDR